MKLQITGIIACLIGNSLLSMNNSMIILNIVYEKQRKNNTIISCLLTYTKSDDLETYDYLRFKYNEDYKKIPIKKFDLQRNGCNFYGMKTNPYKELSKAEIEKKMARLHNKVVNFFPSKSIELEKIDNK